jgi:tight adherence protein B
MHAALVWLSILACVVASCILFAGSARILIQRRRLQAQLSAIANRSGASAVGIADDDVLRPLTTGGYWAGLLSRFSFVAPTARLLRQAGLAWTVERYITLRCILAGVCGAIAFSISHSFIAAAAGAALGAAAPAFYVRRKRDQRRARFSEQLPGVIELMSRALRAGHPLVHGLELAAQDAPEPLASEFRLAYDEHRFGMPLEEAMIRLGERLELTEVRILITAIIVQREAGGNIAEVFTRLAQLMRERVVLNRQVQVHTAQGRLSGTLLSALPIAVGLLLLVLNPDYMMVLFKDPLGRNLLAVAAVLQIIGHFWIKRIVRVEV